MAQWVLLLVYFGRRLPCVKASMTEASSLAADHACPVLRCGMACSPPTPSRLALEESLWTLDAAAAAAVGCGCAARA